MFRSVSLFVCHASLLGSGVQRRLHGSCLEWTLLGVQESLCQTGVRITPRRGGGGSTFDATIAWLLWPLVYWLAALLINLFICLFVCLFIYLLFIYSVIYLFAEKTQIQDGGRTKTCSNTKTTLINSRRASYTFGLRQSSTHTGPRSVQPCLHSEATWQQTDRRPRYGNIDRNTLRTKMADAEYIYKMVFLYIHVFVHLCFLIIVRISRNSPGYKY